MRNLTDLEISSISGGVGAAAGRGVATFGGAAAIVASTRTLNSFGRQVGETLYNIRHPNPLGQMQYTAKDFNKR